MWKIGLINKYFVVNGENYVVKVEMWNFDLFFLKFGMELFFFYGYN